MFDHKYPYTDFHEMNQDYILKQLEIFRTELATLEDKVYNRVMEQVQPQIDNVVADVLNLQLSFNLFTADIQKQLDDYEILINSQIADIERRFTLLVNTVNSLVTEAKTYSDVQNENLYNRIVTDIANGTIGLGDVKVINYITGETMTVQQMFDYLCMFHLTNPITYTQLALKAIDYDSLAALNLTYSDIIVNGNVLIP